MPEAIVGIGDLRSGSGVRQSEVLAGRRRGLNDYLANLAGLDIANLIDVLDWPIGDLDDASLDLWEQSTNTSAGTAT